MKSEEKLKKIAACITELEKKCQKGDNVSEYIKEMEELAGGLSLEELLFIDEYILKEKLLTK